MRVRAHTGRIFLLQTCSKSGVAGTTASNIPKCLHTGHGPCCEVYAPRVEEGNCLAASLCQWADEPSQLPQGSCNWIFWGNRHADTSCYCLPVQPHPWVTWQHESNSHANAKLCLRHRPHVKPSFCVRSTCFSSLWEEMCENRKPSPNLLGPL